MASESEQTDQFEAVYRSRDRLARAQGEMARQGVDVLLVGPSSDLRYLLGLDAHVSERLNLLVLPRDGDPAYVVPTLEAPQLAGLRDLLDVRVWEETQEPAALAAAVVGDPAGKTIAVADQLWSVFLLRLQAAMPAAKWTVGAPVMRPLRMIKDGREIELLQEAARRTDDAWEAFIAQPLAGQTERQALARLLDLTQARGLGYGFGLCASGAGSASPHHHTGDRVIEEGDAVVFDWGGTLDGYNSDVTRTVHVGPPTDEFVRVYEAVRDANQAALDAVRPGAACEEIDLAGRGVIEAAGYGAAFIHRLGHGLGLDVHEEPYLVAGNATPLASGMVFSDEPGVYLEGRFGVRIEDAVLCTDEGGERLNNATRELTILR
ncbi:MAG: Aminopeptidase YpdF (MP-, MA-, MS-, AP-, NP-specific) [uncultured Thermomicrobiales bacterium]|uniref:Aminopeptidase YpdF (MP-, MA-, MS-, AP-, NP-specific) n=1 Tax=uncultured Thermomicrobiales bacterium TaxID=1645740 RepID=A0A6J4VWY3_9BACT|nr:MAG: Aminopeptidase YpdF (MP-, MA-, MS-, AP-, NP-specific) [uncultured Thermomicrobiales bacterium]